jgi:hypothetical protein
MGRLLVECNDVYKYGVNFPIVEAIARAYKLILLYCV